MPDDTEMTAEEFLATRDRGRPVTVVTSRQDYEDRRAESQPPPTPSPYLLKVPRHPAVAITDQRLAGPSEPDTLTTPATG